ncbi:MAG: DUF4249 family protein [Bacteroidota bacterium]
MKPYFPFYQVFILTVCCLFLPNCRDTIELVPKKDQLEGISIQGKLIMGAPSEVRVKVERLFTFSGESRKFLAIASVSILNEKGQEFFLKKNNSITDYIGFIETDDPDFAISTNQSFYCRVVMEDGNTYESAPEMLLSVPPIGSLEFELIQKNVRNLIGDFQPADFIRFKVSSPLKVADSASKSNLRWEIFRTYKAPGFAQNNPFGDCIITGVPDFSLVEVLKGNQVAGDTIFRYELYDAFVNFFFANTYYLSVYQESLTDNAFQYWSELSQLSNRNGNQFEPVPGVIRGNFENVTNPDETVYGFFYATSQQFDYIRVCPSDLNFRPSPLPILDCPSDGVPAFWEECE